MASHRDASPRPQPATRGFAARGAGIDLSPKDGFNVSGSGLLDRTGQGAADALAARRTSGDGDARGAANSI